MSKVAIVGLGYVGLPLAVSAQVAGHQVIGIDNDSKKIEKILAGESYVEDIQDFQLQKALSEGLTATSNFALIESVEIVVICVPTPLGQEGNPDLSYLMAAVDNIAAFLSDGTLIVNESTSMPGTVRELIPSVVARIRPELSIDYAVAPERIDPGNTYWSLKNTPRLIGGVNLRSRSRAVDFYRSFCDEVIEVSRPEVAELAKLLENTFRLVNISLVNELVPLASKIGVSIHEVVRAATSKPYGYTPFQPSVGIGGHCIPVDPVYLQAKGEALGVTLDVLSSSLKVNSKILQFIIDKSEEFRPTSNNNVLILGLSYKSGIADTRESASWNLLQSLQNNGWDVNWWDSKIKNEEFKLEEYQTSRFLLIVTHIIKDSQIDKLISKASHVIDCTGQYFGKPNVTSF